MLKLVAHKVSLRLLNVNGPTRFDFMSAAHVHTSQSSACYSLCSEIGELTEVKTNVTQY